MFKNLKEEAASFNPVRSLIAVIAVIAITYLLAFTLLPDKAGDLKAWSLLPAIFLIVYIFITKRILESLILASVMGFIMISHTGNILSTFSDTLVKVMMSEDIAWLIIVCGLMGSIISLIERSGGAFAFGEWAATKAKSRKTALMWTWVLGIIIFIDDYLNSLTVGSCMTSLTDKHKVPREFLCYVVSSTAAPLCVLIPISTWAVFCGRLLESNGWATKGDGLLYFIKTIPFNFYGWAAALLVPIIVLGIIPIFGPMKKAEKRVAEGGPLAPPGSEKIDIHAGAEEAKMPDKPKMINLFVPIIVLVASTIIFDVDMQMGVLCTLAFMFVFYLIQKVMSAAEFADVCVKGIQNMILPLMLMVLAFLFAEVNSQIGFTKYVIESAANIMTPALMPFVIFLALSVTEFITGTNWGMYIIALPIVIPLAMQMDVNMALAVGAVLSAGVLGSHCCFYSDATILTSAACGCDNFRHAFTQMPFGLLAALFAAIGFLIAGFVCA
ncbi:MAG: Na+/H+ antiporter NhaC family protein [Eubacteriaceae bacterium]|nr:Na+/H+ antiporter NhaC family protein [Eubacteriaceae bacterium]